MIPTPSDMFGNANIPYLRIDGWPTDTHGNPHSSAAVDKNGWFVIAHAQLQRTAYATYTGDPLLLAAIPRRSVQRLHHQPQLLTPPHATTSRRPSPPHASRSAQTPPPPPRSSRAKRHRHRPRAQHAPSRSGNARSRHTPYQNTARPSPPSPRRSTATATRAWSKNTAKPPFDNPPRALSASSITLLAS